MSNPAQPKIARIWLAIGAINALLAVAAGAIGSHALRNSLPDKDIDLFETAARYHMYHALALIVVAWLATHRPGRVTNMAGLIFLVGILFFCGTLYGIPLSGNRSLGMFTPIGGFAFMFGWLLMAIAAFLPDRTSQSDSP